MKLKVSDILILASQANGDASRLSGGGMDTFLQPMAMRLACWYGASFLL